MNIFGNRIPKVLVLSTMLLLSASSSADVIFPTPHDGGTVVPKLPPFLYLRCNSTSTLTNAQSRLLPYQKDGLYSVVYEVKNPDYVSTGDNCVFTATELLDTLATDTLNFSVNGGKVTAPGTAVPNFAPVTTTFKVKYSSLRSYRAILDLANPTVFSIVPSDGKSDGSEGGGGGPVITF